ncbi:MAG TPA: cation diffusion facilitator family transporter [Gemmatimonadales bacterium]|nr:cation diffusion facilitator family transporter [Gemmatimonadales bacterium]
MAQHLHDASCRAHPAGPSSGGSGAGRRDCAHLPAFRRAAPPVRRLTLVLLLTVAFMVVEAVGGWLSGSLALIADAGHMLTDAGALGLSLLTAWIAQRPADQSKTYGYLRWEILAALINGAALLGIAGWVVVEAAERMTSPAPIRTGLMSGVAAAGLLVNLVALALLHRSRGESLNVRGAYLHVLGDLVGSVGTLAAAGVIAVTGWTLADPVISIGLALLILVGAWRLVRESTDILLESVPAHVSMAEVQRRMLAVGGVSAVHDLHVWTVTSGMVAMSGHAVVPDLGDHPGVLERIRAEMAALGIGHVTIQLETQDECEQAPEPALVPGRHRHGDHWHHGRAH